MLPTFLTYDGGFVVLLGSSAIECPTVRTQKKADAVLIVFIVPKYY